MANKVSVITDTESKRRSSTKYIPFMDKDLDYVIISMLEFQGKIYVATQKGIYVLRDEKLVRLKLKNIQQKIERTKKEVNDRRPPTGQTLPKGDRI